MNYSNFVLQFSKETDGRYAATCESSLAMNSANANSTPVAWEGFRAIFQLPVSIEAVRDFYSRLETNLDSTTPSGEEAQALGACLFSAIFDGPHLTVWLRHLSEARAQQQGIRMRLDFRGAPELEELPWELLYDHSVHRFLVESPDISVVRQGEFSASNPTQIDLPLRVWVATLDLTTCQEWELMRSAAPSSGSEGATWSAMQWGRDSLPGLLKFGDKTDQHILQVSLFENENISLENLWAQPDSAKHSLLVLNGSLSRTRVPIFQRQWSAIVTVSFPYSNNVALSFYQEFYSRLAEGFSIDEAMSRARRMMLAVGNRLEWAMPILRLGTESGQLFGLERSSDALPSLSTKPDPAQVALQNETVLRFETPGGTMFPSSPFYIERPCDALTLHALETNRIVTIKGSRQTGKSSLLARVLNQPLSGGEGGKEPRQAFLNFEQLDSTFLANATFESFLVFFCSSIAEELELYDLVNGFKGFSVPENSPASNCTSFMQNEILRRSDRLLYLGIDEVDVLIDWPYRDDFFAMLRGWYSRAAYRGESNSQGKKAWNRLRTILVTSNDPYLLIRNPNQSPFNVGAVIDMVDFVWAEVFRLNKLHGSPFSSNQLRRLFELVGGQPFLTHAALHAVAANNVTANDLLADPAGSNSPFEIHLRTLQSRIPHEGEIWEAFLYVARAKGKPVRDTDAIKRLEGAGLVRQTDAGFVLRCPLYYEYFQRHLKV